MDFFGLIVNVISWIHLFVAYFWSPMCILTNIEPTYKLIKIYYPFLLTDIYSRYALALIRFIYIQHIATECGRILFTITIPFLTMLKTFMDILNLLRRRQLTRQTILVYNQLHCINQMVIDICKGFNAMLLGFAFACCVLINWVIICGWELLGLKIYIHVCRDSIVLYRNIITTVALQVG